MSDDIELIKSNCPRDCYDGCGMIIEKKAGVVSRVLGDPEHPVSRGRLCTKCAMAYNGAWLDPKERLLTPLKRVGPKGCGEFEPISWDQAVTEVTDQLKDIVDQYGGEAIVHTHYSGTLSLIALLFPQRFFLRLGATEVNADTICNAAGHQAFRLVYGESYMGFDPRTIKDAGCVVVWGANPAHSGPHTHNNWFAETTATKIVIDPVRTETAKSADIHLQPLPGTDAALAFGLLHIMQRDGKLDMDFMQAHTLGHEELLPLLSPCTPDWTESNTGVPIALLEQAAQAYAAGPSMLFVGQALQRQATGGNIMRSVIMLPACTGNIGKPGTGICYMNMTPAFAGLDMEYLEGAGLGDGEHQGFSYMEFADQLADSDQYKSLIVWNTNPAASAPNQAKVKQALSRDDLFTVVVDCFQTDTADYADIILPAASFLEFDDLTFSYFHLNIGVQSKAQEPMGDSLPNQEIFRRLAKGMGYTEPELFEDDETLIARGLEEMGVTDGFGGFRQRGWQSLSDEPMIFWEELSFPTDSGKIEIASQQAEDMGLPRISQAWVDEPVTKGQYRLITPASDLRMNDSYANDSKIIAKSGVAEVYIHPEDAESIGIVSGDTVSLKNETGALSVQANVQDLATPGTIMIYKGRWPKMEKDGFNPNVLFAGAKADMAQSTTVHSTLVAITRL